MLIRRRERFWIGMCTRGVRYELIDGDLVCLVSMALGLFLHRGVALFILGNVSGGGMPHGVGNAEASVEIFQALRNEKPPADQGLLEGAQELLATVRWLIVEEDPNEPRWEALKEDAGLGICYGLPWEELKKKAKQNVVAKNPEKKILTSSAYQLTKTNIFYVSLMLRSLREELLFGRIPEMRTPRATVLKVVDPRMMIVWATIMRERFLEKAHMVLFETSKS